MPPTPTPVVDTPAYVFRGHAAAVHVVRIIRNNLFLLTGDADGWVVVWDLLTRRPVVVWRAHKTALLGAAEWGADKIITYGSRILFFFLFFSFEWLYIYYYCYNR